MNRKPKLMTLEEQERAHNRSLDRGKKLIGSCFLSIAVFLFTWSSEYPGFERLGIAAACIGGMVLIHLKQLKLGGYTKVFLTVILFVAMLYFGRQGMLISALASALYG